ncbi:MAG: hypothetical protein ACFBSF_13315 [Leptolyngbyaceae cyanobacterium]
MTLAPIIIIETDYETTEDAIATRNAHAAHLTQQGISFTQETLYRLTDNACVFILTPEDIDLRFETQSQERVKPRTQRVNRQKRRMITQQTDSRSFK